MMNRNENPVNAWATNSEDIGHGLHLNDATSGGTFLSRYINQDIKRIIEPIIPALAKQRNATIIQQTEELVSILIQVLITLKSVNIDINHIPRFHADYLEDGAFSIEWILTDYRVGFVLEKDPKDSMWYWVSKAKSSDSNTMGNLADSEKRDTLLRLAKFVAENS